MVLSVLEAAVLAATDLPRITPTSTNTGITAAPAGSTTAAATSCSNASVIPSTRLDEQLVQDTIKVSRKYLHPSRRVC